MDFGKTFVKEDNVVTKSGIRLLPVPADVTNDESISEDDRCKRQVTRMLIQSANNAATEHFLSTGSKLFSTFKKKKKPLSSSNNKSTAIDDIDTNGAGDDDTTSDQQKQQHQKRLKLVNCDLYKSQILPPTPTISPSSLVVIFESFDSLNFVYAAPGGIFNNRNGHFHHDDFIGKPYGCKIRSRNNRGLGFVYLLKPTPELWARSLNHRTQIVHELDASMVVFQLGLKPNMVVCESGTGSGAMSHAMIRAIAPKGKLHTYEFNKMRVGAAKDDFKSNGVGHLVDVHWRDVCGKDAERKAAETDGKEEDEEETMGSGGFDIGPSIAHAIFLDLPEPWLAIPHAAETLRPNGMVASYSPCVEQSQKTVQKMTDCGFHSIRTLEVRLREHYVDEVTMETVPTKKLPREPNINPFVPGYSVPQLPTKDKSGGNDNKDGTMTSLLLDTNGQGPSTVLPPAEDLTVAISKDPKISETGAGAEVVSKKRKLMCARPFVTIRGHTAFLTFATNGNKAFHTNSKKQTSSNKKVGR